MFNFFKAKKEVDDTNKAQSSLTYYVQEDGEVFVDVNLEDYSTETLNNFAKILSGISSLRFQMQTINMVKHGFLEADRIKEFEELMLQIILLSQKDIDEIEKFSKKTGRGEEPCIKPSDMI